MPEERDEAAQEREADASEEPEAGVPAESDAPGSEEPEAGVPAEPEAEVPEAPEAGAQAEPEARSPDEPEAAASEEPEADASEEGEAPPDERPEAEAGQDERPADDLAAGEAVPSEDRERERPRRRRRRKDEGTEDEVIPGAHLEPDLVLQEEQRAEVAYGELAEAELAAAEEALAEEEPSADVEEPTEAKPVAREPLDLAADARYGATGKRKSAVARVILRPGEGGYTINGRHLDEYFPRVRLQRLARQPLEAAGYQARMDVTARIHGGGVSAQAVALRHGIARALVEADPALRGELKGRGYLTRDPRVKERKKAGLKKARKRPQFSKR
jgi:small subunit ribosomal protein S9